jgi:release factor glutamine methyltransferase
MTTPDDPWTIGRLLSWTIDYLGRHGADNPRLEAEVLLAHARGCRRIDLYASFGEIADEQTRSDFRDLVRRRAAGTPVAYLVGHREFYSLDFEVTPDVLIPRPETELLVVALLDHVKGRGVGGWPLGIKNENASSVTDPSPPSPIPLAIADVGAGSGVLAVCAAKYVPTATVTAIDISSNAIEVAKRNAERHGVSDRIAFFESNLFQNVPAEATFDFIISNPPYVSTAEMDSLAPDVREHEPHIALHAGEHGTSVIAPLVEQSRQRLKSDGVLLIEISPMIAAEVERLIRDTAGFELGATIRDLAGHPRVIQATLAVK